MTHNTVETKRESGGSTDRAFHTIDITSLDSAGTESIDLDNETGVEPQHHGVDVVGQANGGYHITWDHTTGTLSVKYADYDAAADGVLIDVPSGTAVGEVRLRVEGK